MFATCLTLGVAVASLLLAALHLHVRLSAQCRETLRPHAERLLIECRWMERHAKSTAEFRGRWNAEVSRLHGLQVSKPMRVLFRVGSFRQALYAEFTSILAKEVESWTFVDRASASSSSYERLMLRCLKSAGWRLDHQADEHHVLIRDRKRIVVRLLWADRDIECLAISEVAAAAERSGCSTACVITNGRFTGAANAMAAQRNVLLLHCSQLDLLPSLASTTPPVRVRQRERLPMAA